MAKGAWVMRWSEVCVYVCVKPMYVGMMENFAVKRKRKLALSYHIFP